MGREFTAVALFGLFLIGLVGIGLGATPGAGPEHVDIGNESTATITVSGSGTVTAEPDEARVFVAVTTTSQQPSNATDALAAETQRLREALANSSAVDSATTTSYQLFERRENRTRSFVASQSFEIVVTETDAVGQVVDTAVASGATEVNGVSFTLSDERRQELRASALDRAVDDARTEATALAGSSGLVLGEIQRVSTSGDGVGPVFEADVARAGTVIDQGPVTVRATVQLTYAADAEA
jgi:uncharacterized protein YggE